MSAISVTGIQERAARSFESALFATDFSPHSQGALKWFKTIASQCKPKVFVTYFDRTDADDPEPHAPESPEAAGRLNVIREELEKSCGVVASAGVIPLRRDKPFVMRALEARLKKIIAENKLDLVVVGSHGYTGLKRFLLGSFSEMVFRHTDCPVLVVGPEAGEATPPQRISKILFATDFERESVDALPVAADFARRLGATLILAHANRTPRLFQMRDSDTLERLYKLAQSHSIADAVMVELTRGPGAILDYARQEGIGTIVLGVRTEGAEDPLGLRIPGSLACDIIAEAPCPVLTYRGSYQGHALFFRASSGF